MNFKNNKGFLLVELVIAIGACVVAPACLYGWVMNIITLLHSSFSPITGQVVLRIVGIFMAPIGVVMGYL